MKRFGYENQDLPTWGELWTTIWWKLKGVKQTIRMIDFPQFLPCGCENPDWRDAPFSEVVISGSVPFHIAGRK